MFDAVVGPAKDKRSRRQEHLSQDARDLIAWAFTSVKMVPGLGLPLQAVEVRIEDALYHICYGGVGWQMHSGSDSWHYFTHRDNDDWAVVFSWDCDGDPDRGRALADFLGGRGGTA